MHQHEKRAEKQYPYCFSVLQVVLTVSSLIKEIPWEHEYGKENHSTKTGAGAEAKTEVMYSGGGGNEALD